MNYYIENFYDLYSSNDSKVYHAILEKKDWLFKKLYWLGSFKKSTDQKGKVIFPDLFSILDESIPFHSFEMKDELFKENEDKKEAIKNAFDQTYACAYFEDEINPHAKKGEFFVELDFNQIDEKTYKELVANFYPCIDNVEELDLFYDSNRLEDILKFPMYGSKHKWVIILAKSCLLNGKYYLPIIKKVHYSKDLLTEEEIEGLKELCERGAITLEEYK